MAVRQSCILCGCVVIGLTFRCNTVRGEASPDPLTGHYYEYVDTPRTWDAARVEARTLTLGGVIGHLVSIEDSKENEIVRYLGGSTEKWIGLTDSDVISELDGFNLGSLGTFEGGNTSGMPLPPAGQPPQLGERGAGFQWVTGSQLQYMNWRNGVPADASNQADGVYILSQGVWQDAPAGATVGQPGLGQSVLRPSVIEWDTILEQDRFHIVERRAAPSFKNGTGDVVTMDDADTLMSLPSTHIDVADEQNADAVTISFHDPDLGGGFAQYVRRPYLTNITGMNDDNFVLRATGQLEIPAAGEWTFAMMSGDRVRLRVGGNEYSSAGTQPTGPALLTHTSGGGSLTPMAGGSGTSFYFPEAGVYGLELTALESQFFAFIQLFAAEGVHTSFNATDFRLVGDSLQGGLVSRGDFNPDLNQDGFVDCEDADFLTTALAVGDFVPTLDLNYDTQFNSDDFYAWLTAAGVVNFDDGSALGVGDANLDGTVDEQDLSLVVANLYTETPSWCAGDFNLDGSVDGHDFGLWNSNKRLTPAAVTHAVPEFTPNFVALAAVACCVVRLRGVRNLAATRSPSEQPSWVEAKAVTSHLMTPIIPKIGSSQDYGSLH